MNTSEDLIGGMGPSCWRSGGLACAGGGKRKDEIWVVAHCGETGGGSKRPTTQSQLKVNKT
jgi:hypothetical protein